VLARDNDEVDDGWLCDKGRFGYQAFSSSERITAPLVRDGGFLREVSWERALSEAARALQRGGERTAAMVGGTATNEEGFLVQHLLREGLGSGQVDSRAAGPLSGAHARALAAPALAAKVSDIDHAGAILVIDTELVEEAPILDLRVRKAVRRNGARLVVASARPSTLDPNSATALRFAPGAAEAAIGALAAALGSPRSGALDDLAGKARASEGFRAGAQSEARANGAAANGAGQAAASGPAGGGASASPADAVRAAADALRDAGDVVVIWGERVGSAPAALDALLALAGALGLDARDESGLIEVPAGTNGRGLREVGCVPTLEPGLEDAAERDAPEPTALLLVEATVPEAQLAGVATVVAFAAYRDDLLDEHADVVFPASVYAEKEGTVTHPDGRLQRVRQALGHPGEGRAGWWVLAELCELAGAGLDVPSAPAVTAALSEAVPFYAGITLDEIGGRGVRWQERDAASALDAGEPSTEPLTPAPAAPAALTVVSAPSFWTGPATEYSPSLRFLGTGPRAELSVDDARAAGVDSGDEVRLSAAGESVVAVVAVRTGVPAGSVFLSGAELPLGPVELETAVAVR
jgi:NADH-quinone oxidoreductase subunit G